MDKIRNNIISTIVLSIAIIFFAMAMAYFKIINMQEEINYNKEEINNLKILIESFEKNGINII